MPEFGRTGRFASAVMAVVIRGFESHRLRNVMSRDIGIALNLHWFRAFPLWSGWEAAGLLVPGEAKGAVGAAGGACIR